MAGVLVVVVGPSLATALIGIILWGLGATLGFPTGMSAAADEPRYAAGRVSTVATLGYVAFLAGPSLIGLIGNETGVLRALTVTAGLLALGFAVAGSTRPLEVAPAVDVPRLTCRGRDTRANPTDDQPDATNLDPRRPAHIQVDGPHSS